MSRNRDTSKNSSLVVVAEVMEVIVVEAVVAIVLIDSSRSSCSK